MASALPNTFFDKAAPEVARALIGTYLVRQRGGVRQVFQITETEAYGGQEDRASHARHGKTPRNAPMFAQAGTIYVYFTYGMHWMLNIAAGAKDEPSAVLIRAVRAVRPAKTTRPLNGPAKLTKYLHIDKALNGQMLGRSTGLWIEKRREKIAAKDILTTPRIGVGYAGIWAKRRWRFVLKEIGE